MGTGWQRLIASNDAGSRIMHQQRSSDTPERPSFSSLIHLTYHVLRRPAGERQCSGDWPGFHLLWLKARCGQTREAYIQSPEETPGHKSIAALSSSRAGTLRLRV